MGCQLLSFFLVLTAALHLVPRFRGFAFFHFLYFSSVPLLGHIFGQNSGWGREQAFALIHHIHGGVWKAIF